MISQFRTRSQRLVSRYILALLAFGLAGAAATPAAAAVLQCAPYARAQSGIAIYGNAGTWWDQAEGRYQRGSEPRVGAVLAFQPSRAMPIGHVAVVAEIVDDRRVYLNHANWSGPGRIERRALAEDVSPNGDWSQVRVWYAPQRSLGLRANPTAGFIYNETARETAPSTIPPMTIAAAASAGTDVSGRLR